MNQLIWPQAARDFDTLGEEQKLFEKMKLDVFMPGIPIIARLDGKAFHTFTKGLDRPFDKGMQTSMKETLVGLCEKFQCDLGYSQSDEITLVWYNTNPKKMIYDGRSDKFLSLLASTASVLFYKGVIKHIPQKAADAPVFDCRVFQVPSPQKVFENVLWRWLDARKNSVSMLASSMFSPKQLLNKSTKIRKEMLKEKGIIWEDLPDDSKFGYFCKRTAYFKLVDEQFKENINDPIEVDGEVFVIRKKYDIVKMPSLYIVSDNYAPDNLVDGRYQNGMKILYQVFSEGYINSEYELLVK